MKAEVEATQQAARERTLRLQKEREARAAALDARVTYERARIQAKFWFDRDGIERLYTAFDHDTNVHDHCKPCNQS
jgi:hypothetical protein